MGSEPLTPLDEEWWHDRLSRRHSAACDGPWVGPAHAARPWQELSAYDVQRMAAALAENERIDAERGGESGLIGSTCPDCGLTGQHSEVCAGFTRNDPIRSAYLARSNAETPVPVRPEGEG